MDWGNAIITKIEKNADGIVTRMEAKLNLDGDVKKTALKLTWLPNLPDLLVDVKLVDFDVLITKPSLEEGDNFLDFVNPNTIFEVSFLHYVLAVYALLTHTNSPHFTQSEAFGDPNLRMLQKGDRIQFERKGYFICDSPVFKGMWGTTTRGEKHD